MWASRGTVSEGYLGVDDLELGRRIAYWRERRGMTQQLFADRIGRSKSWVEKAEAGSRSAGRLSVLETVCEVLRVDLPVLIGRELSRDSEQCLDNSQVEAIRAAMERYEGVAVSLGDAGADAPDLGALRREVDYLWCAFEAADYEVAGRALPRVLHASQRAHAAYRNGESARILAEVYQITASTARKLGEFDLAWVAGDRGIPVAEESGDLLLTATGAFRVANALLAVGRVRAGYDLNVAVADRLEPHLAGPAELSVFGTMLLQAAIAAARMGDNRTARDLVREAHVVAERVGTGRDEYHTAFGPVNVGIHRVSALVELGEGGAAVEAAALIPVPGLEGLRRERRANHLVDVARGYSQWGKGEEALARLLEAERFAPAEVRCRPMARATVTDLLRRSRSAPSGPLRRLAERAGVAA
jgi:transcriptional regulator with XRE-family HTH domain